MGTPPIRRRPGRRSAGRRLLRAALPGFPRAKDRAGLLVPSVVASALRRAGGAGLSGSARFPTGCSAGASPCLRHTRSRYIRLLCPGDPGRSAQIDPRRQHRPSRKTDLGRPSARRRAGDTTAAGHLIPWKARQSRSGLYCRPSATPTRRSTGSRNPARSLAFGKPGRSRRRNLLPARRADGTAAARASPSSRTPREIRSNQFLLTGALSPPLSPT